jgi:hypothetical protein
MACQRPPSAREISSVIEDGLPHRPVRRSFSEGGSLGESGMATMRAKFKEMSEQVYVEVEKVKECNGVLCEGSRLLACNVRKICLTKILLFKQRMHYLNVQF